MGEHVNQGVLRTPAATPVPFPIFNGLPHYQNGTIPIGSEFVDVLLDIPVQDTALTLVILNASSCIVPGPYTQNGPADIEGVVTPITGAIVATLTGIELTYGGNSYSEGAWYDWVDETTIRIHRGGGECDDCFDNCVNFSVQILEFLPGMFQSPA